MKKQFQISIPNPCHQNWHEMNIVEKGRFCDSCQKTVIDFTMYSDVVILKAVKNTEHLCGRFLPDQLDRILIQRKEKAMFWQVGMVSFLGFIGLGNQVSFGQEVIKKEVTIDLNNSINLNKNLDIKRTEIDFVIFCYDQKEKASFLIRNINTNFMRTVANDETIKMNAAVGDRIFIDNEDFVNDIFIIDEESIRNKFFTLGVALNEKKIAIAGGIAIQKQSFLQKLTRPFRNLFKKKKCTTSLLK